MVEIVKKTGTSDLEIRACQVIDKHLFDKIPIEALMKATDKIVEQVVEKIVSEKIGEVLAKVDTQAIANLAIARAATRIADELGAKK